MKSRKKTIKIAYSTFDNGNQSTQYYKNKFYESFYYKLIIHELSKNNFKLIYDDKNPDFIIEQFHYNPIIPKKAVRIVVMGEVFVPNFHIYDYGAGYDYIEFGDRYKRFPLWIHDYPRIDFTETKVFQTPAPSKEEAYNILKKKTRFCSFVVSNNRVAQATRIQFFHLLSTYKQVSSGGKVLRNVEGEEAGNKGLLEQNSKFAIVFENTSQRGYNSEKLMHTFPSNLLPIYWGCPDVAQEFNPKCFINCHDFSSFEQVVERVKEIDNDDDLWCEMVSVQDKININRANQTLKDFKDWLCNILMQNPIQAKRCHSILKETLDTYKLWHIKNKYTLSTQSLEKIAKPFYRKERGAL